MLTRWLKFIFSISIGISFTIPLFGQQVLWDKRADDMIWNGVTVDSDGNIIVTGHNSAFSQIITRKYASDGETLWTEVYDGGGNNAQGKAVCTDQEGNIIVTGSIYQNSICGCFTIKYNPQGDTIWTNWFNPYGYIMYGNGLTSESDNNIVVVGTIQYSPWYGFALRLDRLGVPIDTVLLSMGGYEDTHAQEVAIDNMNNILITGGSITFPGYPGFATIWTYKLDSNLAYIWHEIIKRPLPDFFLSPTYEGGYGIAADNTDNIFVTGALDTAKNMVPHFYWRTIKYSSSGNSLWAKNFGLGWGYGAAIDNAGNVILVGTLSSIGARVYKCEPINGDSIWADTYPTGFYWKGVTADNNGNFIVAGDSSLSEGVVVKYGEPPGIVKHRSNICKSLEIFPNPFSFKLTINLPLIPPKASFGIYDISGRLVKSFSLYVPHSSVTWDGTDNLNRKVPTGVYFVQIKTDRFKETKKIILLR
jgi:hypothetical protein